MPTLYSSLSYVDAKQYGIVADGTDQYAALTALFATIADGGTDPDGCKVILPIGIIGLSQQLIVPDKVALIGQSKRSTIIKALTGFPVSTSVISLGPLAAGNAFDCYLQNMEVDANSIAGSNCVQTTRGQEGAGLRNVLLSNFKANGFYGYAVGNNAANLMFVDIECLGASGSTNGILLDTVGGANLISRVTCNGGATSGIRIKSTMMVGSAFHFESLTNGLYCEGDNAACKVDGIIGAGTAVTQLVYISSGRRIIVSNIVLGTATNAVKDDGNGMTLTNTFVQEYGGTRYFGNLINEFEAVGVSGGNLAIDMGYPDYKRCNTLTTAAAVQTPTNPLTGMRLTIRFVQDATGGRAVTWASVFKGVTLAASGTTDQRAVIEFFYDGTYWYQTGTSGWIT